MSALRPRGSIEPRPTPPSRRLAAPAGTGCILAGLENRPGPGYNHDWHAGSAPPLPQPGLTSPAPGVWLLFFMDRCFI
ncbi:MAG TPA: hypothetical protein VN578_20865 [Candidatus Binatia bacterium]|nr:hypothetical protein [Candidatus Binatia bacterium]